MRAVVLESGFTDSQKSVTREQSEIRPKGIWLFASLRRAANLEISIQGVPLDFCYHPLA